MSLDDKHYTKKRQKIYVKASDMFWRKIYKYVREVKSIKNNFIRIILLYESNYYHVL